MKETWQKKQMIGRMILGERRGKRCERQRVAEEGKELKEMRRHKKQRIEKRERHAETHVDFS